jgi:hypothetical protein
MLIIFEWLASWMPKKKENQQKQTILKRSDTIYILQD